MMNEENNQQKAGRNVSSSSSEEKQQEKTDLKKAAIFESSGIDSGFMSGPQLSMYDSDEDDANKEAKEKENNKIITSTATGTGVVGVIITQATVEDEEQDNKIATDSGLSLEVTQSDKQQMLLDSGVDTSSGLNEWFCNLNLKDNNQLQTKLNDLNSSSAANKKSTKPSIKSAGGLQLSIQQQQQNIQKQQQSPWYYYQQNSEGDTQLHIACVTGYADVVAALIHLAPHPCLLDIRNDDALSALHIAVMTEQTNIVRMLLCGGASPVSRDRNGNTPLHLACSYGNLELVKALTIPITVTELQQKNWTFLKKSKNPIQFCSKLPQDLELRNYDGERCVHVAAQNNNIDILRYLISIGADINAREGKSGLSPLHIAIEMCNEKLANFLIEECQQKIDLENETYAGLTPYQLAVLVQFSQMQSNLEKHGAQPLTPPDSEDEDDSYSDGDDVGSNDKTTELYNRLINSHQQAINV